MSQPVVIDPQAWQRILRNSNERGPFPFVDEFKNRIGYADNLRENEEGHIVIDAHLDGQPTFTLRLK